MLWVGKKFILSALPFFYCASLYFKRGSRMNTYQAQILFVWRLKKIIVLKRNMKNIFQTKETTVGLTDSLVKDFFWKKLCHLIFRSTKKLITEGLVSANRQDIVKASDNYVKEWSISQFYCSLKLSFDVLWKW